MGPPSPAEKYELVNAPANNRPMIWYLSPALRTFAGALFGVSSGSKMHQLVVAPPPPHRPTDSVSARPEDTCRNFPSLTACMPASTPASTPSKRLINPHKTEQWPGLSNTATVLRHYTIYQYIVPRYFHCYNTSPL